MCCIIMFAVVLCDITILTPCHVYYITMFCYDVICYIIILVNVSYLYSTILAVISYAISAVIPICFSMT